MGLYYERQLEAKIERQKEEITRLLKENAELKKGREAIRDNAFEAGLIRGQEEAWELAQKIALYERDGGFSIDELEEIFETQYWTDVFLLTYSETIAKIEALEKAKEEICVGDVVECEGNYGVVICDDFNIVFIIIPNGSVIIREKDKCTKTGRHIDVDAWLAQIGGESND